MLKKSPLALAALTLLAASIQSSLAQDKPAPPPAWLTRGGKFGL